MTHADVMEYASYTLLFASCKQEKPEITIAEVEVAINRCLNYLEDNHFIEKVVTGKFYSLLVEML